MTMNEKDLVYTDNIFCTFSVYKEYSYIYEVNIAVDTIIDFTEIINEQRHAKGPLL